MIKAWIVVHDDPHTDNQHVVFTNCNEAITYAALLAAREAEVYGIVKDDPNVDVYQKCSGDVVFMYQAEDRFTVYVEPVQICGEGESP
jgi:hypothetical protein